MEARKNFLLIALLMMFFIVSHRIHCQNNVAEIKLERDSGPVHHYYYTFVSDEINISLNENQEKKFTVDLTIPLDVKIDEVNIWFDPPTEGEIATDTTIALGSETIAEIDSFVDFNFEIEEYEGEKCKEKLKKSLNKYLSTNPKEEEYAISVPLVFESEQEGAIVLKIEVVYMVRALKELHKEFFWDPGQGSNPKYDLEIRVKNDFYMHPFVLEDDPSLLLQEHGIVGTFYELTVDDIEKLKSNFQRGKIFYWGVRAVYDYGKSQWTTKELTWPFEPNPVTGLKVEETSKTEIKFSWNEPGNAEHYIVALNGIELIQNLEKPPFSILTTNSNHMKYLCPCGSNILTVWAESGGKRSKYAICPFEFEMDKLDKPVELFPNLKNPVKDEKFSFMWEGAESVAEYNMDYTIDYPTGERSPDGGEERIEITTNLPIYNPWDNGGLKLTPGEKYTWRVRAVPSSNIVNKDSGNPYTKSDWTVETFVYRPVLLPMLLFSVIGGLLGGFTRIASEEQGKAKEEKRRMEIRFDPQTYTRILVGAIIGVVFYLLVYQTELSTYFIKLHISPFNNPGSFLLGFLGGLISYEITKILRLKLKPG